MSRRGFEADTLSITEDFLRDISETYQLPVPEYLHAPQSGVFIPNSQAVQNLRRAIRCLLDDDEARLDEEQEAALVVELLTGALVGSRIEDKSTPATRARAISAALDYLEDHRHEAVAVGEICADTGVSWRTLDRAFRERFDVSPKVYLKQQRLAAVRIELLICPGDTVIEDVDNNRGFWHMGQFARDHQGLFGELPSEVLRRP